jgi:hypothetical protein
MKEYKNHVSREFADDNIRIKKMIIKTNKSF